MPQAGKRLEGQAGSHLIWSCPWSHRSSFYESSRRGHSPALEVPSSVCLEASTRRECWGNGCGSRHFLILSHGDQARGLCCSPVQRWCVCLMLRSVRQQWFLQSMTMRTVVLVRFHRGSTDWKHNPSQNKCHGPFPNGLKVPSSMAVAGLWPHLLIPSPLLCSLQLRWLAEVSGTSHLSS